MNKEPTDIATEVFRLVGEIVNEKPQVARALAERLSGLLNKPAVPVFEIFGKDGESGVRKHLAKLGNDHLFRIIYAYDFEPETIPLKAKKAVIVDHVVKHLKAAFKENRQLAAG
jgi:hypothetical protein